MTRREFMGNGFAAFVSLFGGRLFAAPPGWKHGGVPNLAFGVISDTHLRTTTDGKYSRGYWSDRWIVAALRHFREQNVDAVVHCGDMAHLGQVVEMEFHRAAWDKVFPRDLAPDGHKVERLFVTGNHDLDAPDYGIGELVKKIHPDEEERKKHLLRTDIAANWERIWGEPYSDVWHRTVKGYHFFGRHYVSGKAREKEAEVVGLVKKTFGAEGSGGRPFFLFSHIKAHADMNKAMRAYPDAVSFFGHWHCSAADWNRIFMWSTGPSLHCPACCPQANNSLNAKPYEWSKTAVEGAEAGGKSRQGYVVKIYDDMLVVERREFTNGGSLGADWVMPFNRGTGNGERGTGNGERGTGNGERIPRAKRAAQAVARGVGTGNGEVVEGIEILRFKPIYPWWPMPKRLVDELDRKGGNPFVPGLGKALREWKPDVIHCHAMARIAELCLRVGECLSKVEGRRSPGCRMSAVDCPKRPVCVVSLHGGGANVPDEEAKSLKAPTRGRLPWGKMVDILMCWTRRVPEDFDGIVCVGEDEYLKYKEKHPHVMFLPNGVDTRLFERSKNATVDSRRSTVGQLSILCVARIDRQKNQMMIVEALAKHPEMTARLVGPVTQQDYRDELERRAVELGVADRIAFVGALKPGSPELLGEYAKADVFVLPSRHEPFGIVVLEAWAAGLPVVASDVGGLGKLCAAHPGASLTFAPGDFGAMDCALRRLVSDGDLRVRLSAAGHAAAAEYDWRTLSSCLVDFYAEI